MKPADWKKKLIKPALIMVMLAALLGSATACEELGYPSTPTPAEEEAAPEAAKTATTSRTKDDAILAVYQRLLGQAKSYEAKIYLSDFYATCDNWSWSRKDSVLP